jgi:ribosomal protein L12E/L44/L45/RPP1/RPP2
VPTLAPLLPLAVHATAGAPAATPLLLRGRLLCGKHNLVLARQQGANLAVELLGCGEEQGWEWVRARVLGLLPGFADVEVQHGSFLSPARALLALPCPAAVAEVRQLERSTAGIACLDSFLRDMGLVVQYLNRRQLGEEGYPCPSYGPTLLAAIAGKARSLVAAAVARGWVAVTQMLLPAVTADGLSASDAVAAMDACCPEGTSLLHVAVGTGNVPLVQSLSSWGATQGRPWLVDVPAGSAGITPLHVATLLPNSSDMREALAGMAPSVDKLWGLVQAQDGTTPESLFEALAAAAAAAPEASAASTASTSSAAGTSCAAAKQQPSGSKPAAELETLAGKPGAEADDACCGSGQRRMDRSAMKQHLNELHLTTILSEVESLSSTETQDPRPLAGALSGTLAAGAALLRMLRGGGRQ